MGTVQGHVARRAKPPPELSSATSKASVGPLNADERHAEAMLAKFGRDAFRDGLSELLDWAERQAREILRSIRHGEHFFSDGTDENGVGLALILWIKDDKAALGFTGTDPQLTPSLNAPKGEPMPCHTPLLVGASTRALHAQPAARAQRRA